jgi:hypothetical protein
MAAPASSPYGTSSKVQLAPQAQAAQAMPAPTMVASAAPLDAGWNPLQERQRLSAPPPVPAVNPQHAMMVLRDAANPEQREWAAVNLATVSWQSSPQVVEALLTAARKDPAPIVRAACVRSLARMHVNTAPAIGVLQALKADPDPRVQREATEALQRLMGGPAR